MNIIPPKLEANVSDVVDTVFFTSFVFSSFYMLVPPPQSSDDLDTDTEFEPVEDMTLETRSRCKDF